MQRQSDPAASPAGLGTGLKKPPPKRPAQSPAARSKRVSGTEGTNGASRRSSTGSRGSNERTVKRLRLSKALTIPESTTVADAARRMASRRVDAALLTDSSALLCGIVTDKDVSARVIAEGLNPEDTLVSQIMTRNPQFVNADSSAVEALQKMVQGKFRHLPVVENAEVVALLDITKCLYDAIARMERAAEKGNAIAAAVEGVERQWEDGSASDYAKLLREKMFRPTLSSLITPATKVAVCIPTDSVYEATRKMKEAKSNSVVISTGGRPQGILTSKDVLMRVVAQGFAPATTAVGNVMTPNPETATLDTTIVDALHTMHDGKFLHLPVVDKSGTCVAIADVLALTHGAVSQMGSGGAGLENENMLQRFWDSAMALDGEEETASLHGSDISGRLHEMNGQLPTPGAFPAPGASFASFVFKVEDTKGQMHRFNCGSQSLSELQVAVAERIGDVPPGDLKLTYVDDDGDLVTLSSDTDLVSAASMAKHSGRKNIRLFLPGQAPHKGAPELRPPEGEGEEKSSSWGFSTSMFLVTAVACAGIGLAVYSRYSGTNLLPERLRK